MRVVVPMLIAIYLLVFPGSRAHADYGSQWRSGSARSNFYLNPIDADGSGNGVLAY
jgi:hypothetical protein